MDRKTRLIGERRATVDFPARYGPVKMASTLNARVTQISTTGLRLRTADELAIGAVVNIAFDVDSSPPISCAIRAQVVRNLPGHKPEFEYGLVSVDDMTNSLEALCSVSLGMP